MNNILFKVNSLSSFSIIFLLLFSQNTFAGNGTVVGTMTFSIPRNGVENIPTLNGTMLILLSLLLFIVAFRVSKHSGEKSNKLFVSLLSVFALSSSIGGVKTMSEANAGGATEATTLTLVGDATIGTVDILGPETQYYDNSFGVPVTILEIDIFEGFSCDIPLIGDRVLATKPIIPSSPTCSSIAPDNIIPVDAQCQLTCFNEAM